MALGTFLALLLFAFTTSITPGPNNMMLFTSGVNFGFRRTIPHMLGIGVGFFVLLIAVGLGLGALLHTVPLLYTALKFAGGAYLVWIAWKIGTSRSLSERESGAQPMSFISAAAFQWVNPKAWVMAVTAMVMLNHLSRTGTDSQSRSAEPKPAQVETLGTLTAAKARPTSSTLKR